MISIISLPVIKCCSFIQSQSSGINYIPESSGPVDIWYCRCDLLAMENEPVQIV